jgi:hypothetical protein
VASPLDRSLAAYVSGEVHPFCAAERARLDACGLGAGGVRSVADLVALPPVDPDEVDGLSSVLRPSAASLGRSGLRWQWHWARLTLGRAKFVEETVEPRYRTVHFEHHEGLLVASTDADLDRLGELGRRWLERAGVRRADALVSLLPAHPDLAFWQLALGCRRGGVPALHLGEDVLADDIAWFAPSVLVGRAAELARAIDEADASGADLSSVRLVIVAGEPLGAGTRRWLVEAFRGADVLAAWAPPGVRSLWGECIGGQLHTWPDTEVVEVLDRADRRVRSGAAGRIVWTPVGWHGTVALRLRTPLLARIVEGQCPSCGDKAPRLVPPRAEALPEPELPPVRSGRDLERALAGVLDAEPLVAAWQAERSWSPRLEEVIVLRLAPVRGGRAALEALLPELGEILDVARLVVERPSLVDERLRMHDDRRVVDVAPIDTVDE